ncbi:MAG: transporter permease [Segetibacter sp.]|jgi:hypothetical protein|nr:transporter permease [Segetibacter sp.]
MRKYLLLLLLVAGCTFAQAQQANIVTEEKPVEIDGIEYGFSVKNLSTKDVGKQDFSRYQVSLFVTNKNQCSRVILFGQSLAQSDAEMKVLAKFDCINATGARLTSKSGQVEAKPMYVSARVPVTVGGKTGFENQKVQVGFYVGAGETVTNDVIFLVPLNHKPELRVRILNKASSI